MLTRQDANAARKRRHRRIRRRVTGTGARPRLSVFRSARHIYAQLIDDESGITLAAASSLDGEVRQLQQSDTTGKGKVHVARLVGDVLARRAQSIGIKQVVFDRGGYRYHGRVQALAEAAREAGLLF